MSLIKFVDGCVIFDSRGDKTIEITVKLDNGKSVFASVPHGKSRGSFEAQEMEPEQAVDNIKNFIKSAITGLNPLNQKEIDDEMIKIDGTPNKSKLGANAILGVSLACAKAGAVTKGLPLWRHLRNIYGGEGKPKHSPRLFANIINGGLHAKNELLFQEYIVIPKSHNASKSLEIIRKIYNATKNILDATGRGEDIGDEGGFAPVFKNYFEPFEILKQAVNETGLNGEIDFGLDAAANNINIGEKELFLAYEKMKNNYNLRYLEDPFSEDDFDKFASLLFKFRNDITVAGDDLTVTNPERMKNAKETNSINGIIIKPNQIGTISETINAIKQAKDWGWLVVVSHRSGETMDDFIADLAFAVEADGLKAGAPFQKERLAKYERLAMIENKGY
ncbi:MAG: phosphopyruvate hydratase [Patescibacteria group bacterium]